jgi:hypothetical protein
MRNRGLEFGAGGVLKWVIKFWIGAVGSRIYSSGVRDGKKEF